MTAWSYSSIKTFDQCPKKYYHLKVAKDVKDEGNDASRYGNDAHEAAEHHIKHGTPIPEKFKVMQPVVHTLAKFPGEKHTELKLGVRKTATGYAPCGFFDKDVWWRGIVDLLITNGSTAHMVDYKTGKNAKYADMKQLDLMAGAVFVHYPEIQKVKSGLAFVVSNEFPKKTHTREHLDTYLAVFDDQLEQLEDSMQNGVWNAKTSPLCGWCPVKGCEHWKPRRY
jgi:predicted RecB family nuclease